MLMMIINLVRKVIIGLSACIIYSNPLLIHEVSEISVANKDNFCFITKKMIFIYANLLE